jgi:hypothetical protein
LRVTRAAAAAWLAVIVAIGLLLRVKGLAFGLPHVYNPDEVAILARAMAFATGDLNPHNFVYPTLYFYLLFAWEGVSFVAGRLTGVFGSVADFERAFFVDPTFHYLAGRVLSVVFGAATIVAVYRLGSRLFDRPAGLAAAAFLAVSPIAARDAHYIKHDVPVTFVIVAVHVILAGLIVTPAARARRGRWIAAGALSGLAVSMHYYAVLLAAPLVFAAWVASPDRTLAGRARIAALVAAAAAVCFFAGSPFILADPMTAYRDAVANRQIVMDRAVAPGGLFGSLPDYVRLLATDGLTWPVTVMAAVGVVFAFSRRSALQPALLLIFPVAFLLFIANTVPASRYLNPVLPLLAVAAGLAVALAARSLPRAGLVSAGLIVGLAPIGLLDSLRMTRFFAEDDTRTLALEFIAREIPPGATLVVQPYSVPLRPSREALVEGLRANLGSEDRASVKFRKMLALDPYPSPAYRVIYLGDGGLDDEKIYVSPAALVPPDPIAPLLARGVEYVVLKRYNDESSIVALVEALERRATRLAEFAPWFEGAAGAPIAPFLHNTDARIDARLARPGPAIDVWRLTR